MTVSISLYEANSLESPQAGYHNNWKVTNTVYQADKLQTIIKAAKIDDVEPIWTSLFAKALEGKDVKDLLLNVGSGGGAAAAPAAGGAAGGEAAAAETKEEEKEEGTIFSPVLDILDSYTDMFCSQGGVRRGYGFRSFRLERFSRLSCSFKCMATVFLSVQHLAGRVGFHR